MFMLLLACTALTSEPVRAETPQEYETMVVQVLEQDCAGANSVELTLPATPSIYQVEWCIDGSCSNDESSAVRAGTELLVYCARPEHDTVRVTVIY